MCKLWRTARTAMALALVMVVGACATMSVNTITNLTPSRLPRNQDGQYWLSVQFDSRQRTMMRDTLRGLVIVGDEVYELAKVPLTNDRWETLVPVPADKTVVEYFFRFEFEYKAMSAPRFTAIDSRTHRLTIVSDW